MAQQQRTEDVEDAEDADNAGDANDADDDLLLFFLPRLIITITFLLFFIFR